MAENVSYDELEPLFNTAAKKVGTRIAAILTLSVLIKNGQEKNAAINEFIEKALEDNNTLLVAEAKAIYNRFIVKIETSKLMCSRFFISNSYVFLSIFNKLTNTQSIWKLIFLQLLLLQFQL